MKHAPRPLGAWYAVIMKTSEFSHARNFASGAFGGKGSFPTPELGTSCVCCDRETPSTRSFDPSTDRIRADALAIPVCPDCDAHIPRSTTSAQLAGAAICVGGGLALWGAAQALWPVAAAGAVITGLVAVWGVRRKQARARLAATGHHAGLEIGVINGLCSVRTTNPRLAAEVLERNRSLVSRVR